MEMHQEQANLVKCDVSRPLVSVGIPTFNRCEYLRTAVESIRNQTYTNIEIIISDNASTDGTQGYCTALTTIDKRVKYIRHGQNIGANPNFQHVLCCATGEFFMWEADDDFCDPLHVERLMEQLLSQPDLVLCSSEVKRIGKNGDLIRVDRLPELYSGVDWNTKRKSFFEYWPSNSYYILIYGIYKTDALRDCVKYSAPLGFKKTLLYTEVPLMAAVAAKGRIGAVPHATKNFRVHGANYYLGDYAKMSLIDHFLVKFLIRARILRIIFGSSMATWEKIKLTAHLFKSYAQTLPKETYISIAISKVGAWFKSFAFLRFKQ